MLPAFLLFVPVSRPALKPQRMCVQLLCTVHPDVLVLSLPEHGLPQDAQSACAGSFVSVRGVPAWIGMPSGVGHLGQGWLRLGRLAGR